MVVIQHIETSWLKNERGAHGGTLRDKTPAALSLPPDATINDATGILLHRVVFGRAAGMPEEQIARLSAGEVAAGCVRVVPGTEVTTVVLAWTPECGGKPIRWQTGREPNWSINRGQWCQLRYNGRIDIGDTWRYQITTVNVGVFERAALDAFLRYEPAYRREDFVRLV